MSITNVSSLHIYPIKSTAGICVSHAKVEEMGLAFDRRFIVSDLSGQFITARTEPKLCLVHTKLVEQGIELFALNQAMNMPTLILSYEKFSKEYKNVTVWKDNISGQLCSKEADAWFSHYLQRPCQLLFFGAHSRREGKPLDVDTNIDVDIKNDKNKKIAFADGYPLLLISQASLNDLNQRLESKQQQTVSMAQFRPNIVIDNCLPFAEDGWQHIRIGNVEFKVSKPCERCIFTTVNPKNAEQHPEQEPLRTLKSFRQTNQGEVLFGQNLIALNKGQIKEGDKLTVIRKQNPSIFNTSTKTNLTQTTLISNNDHKNNKEITATINKKTNKKINIYFKKWNKSYQSSDKKTLLEQGEDAGLILPFSCCAGMCGSCKAKLISGEVIQSSSDGLTIQEKQAGYILCCSTIAVSDVIISHE